MKTLPELATNLMKEWYEAHCDKPYPMESERQELARLGQITESQVKAWFANKRNRTFNTRSKMNKNKLMNKTETISPEAEQHQTRLNYLNSYYHHPFVLNANTSQFLSQSLNALKEPIVFFPANNINTKLKPKKPVNSKPKSEDGESGDMETNDEKKSDDFQAKNQPKQKINYEQSVIAQTNDYTNQLLSLINNSGLTVSTSQPNQQIIGSLDRQLIQNLQQHFQQQQLLLDLNNKGFNNQVFVKTSPAFHPLNNNAYCYSNNYDTQAYSPFSSSSNQYQSVQPSKICYDSCCFINPSPTSSNSSYQSLNQPSNSYSTPPATLATNTPTSCVANETNECNIFECTYCQENSLTLDKQNHQTCLNSVSCSHNASWSSLSNIQQCDTPPPIITKSSFSSNNFINNNNSTNNSSPSLLNQSKSDSELETPSGNNLSSRNSSPASFYSQTSQKLSCFNTNSKLLNNLNKTIQFSSDESESNRFKFKCSLKNRYFQSK